MSEHDSHDHDHDDGPYGEAEVHAHVGSYKVYFAVFWGLVGFTLLTVAVAAFTSAGQPRRRGHHRLVEGDARRACSSCT